MKKYYGPRLRMLHCCTDQAITNALAEMELTAAQGRILGFLSRQPQPPCPKDIEEVFRLRHSTVSGLLNRLEKKDFIAIQPDPADKRCKRICMLEKGALCCQLMDKTIEEMEQQMVQGFTPEEQTCFSDLLDRAITNMGGGCRRPPHKEDIK